MKDACKHEWGNEGGGLTEDVLQGLNVSCCFFSSRLCQIFPIVDCAAFLYKSCTLKTSTLCVATYIYTYSGDAPMNARWVQLLCMIYTFITNQYKSMASLKMSSSFSCLCCSVEVAANPLLATYAHAGHIEHMFPKPLTVCILCTFQGAFCASPSNFFQV